MSRRVAIPDIPPGLDYATAMFLSAVRERLIAAESATTTTAPTFPSGTRLAFQQETAPLGWTKETAAAYNDATLRFVTGTPGTGGADNFSSAFGAGKTTAGHALITAELAAHAHTGTSDQNNVGHTHNVSPTAWFNGGNALGENSGYGTPAGSNTYTTTGNSANHTHTFTTDNAGSGDPHTHDLSNFDLKYVDFIVATKD